MSPRPAHAHCACNTVGTLATADLVTRATYYAHALTDGDTIDDDVGGVDADYVAPFREYLPEALMAAGFRITARLVQSRVVTTVYRD